MTSELRTHAVCRDHFWLNEGWTRFVETKIMERHEGKAIAHMKVPAVS